MTVEDRLQQMIGAQAFQIAILQTENEKLQTQIAEAQKQKDAPAPGAAGE